MSVIHFALLLAMVYAGLVGSAYVRGIRALRHLTFRLNVGSEVPEENVSSEDVTAFRGSRERLEMLGFSLCYFEGRPDENSQLTPPVLVMRDTVGTMLAELTLEAGFDVARVSLSTHFRSGEVLVTEDCMAHFILDLPPEVTLLDDYTGSVEAQYAVHAAAVTRRIEQGDDAIAFQDLDEQKKILRASALHVHEYLVDAEVVDGETGKMTVPTAFRLIRRIRGGSRRASQARKRAARDRVETSVSSPGTQTPADDIQAAVIAYQRFLQISKPSPLSAYWKLALFIGTALLFSVTVSQWFSFEFAFGLLVVLAIHEFGHVLAMKAFGYRDLSILFVPFLGALAIGKKEKPRLLERIIVSLMGPLPGILIGLALLEWGDLATASVRLYAALFLIVNYINLMPLMPLDGGHVVNNTLFARSPGRSLAFTLVSMIGMVWLGVALKEPILLIVVMLLSLSLPSQIKRYRIVSGANWAGIERDDESTAMRRTLENLSDLRSAGPIVYFQWTQSLLAQMTQPRAPLWESTVAMLAYALALSLPFLLSDWPGEMLAAFLT